MKPQDFIHQQAYKAFGALGYAHRQCEAVADDAVERWRKNGGGVKAVEAAIAAGKKSQAKRNAP